MRLLRLIRNALALAALTFVAAGGAGPLSLYAQGDGNSCVTCGDCKCCNCESCKKGFFWTCSCTGCATTAPKEPPPSAN